MQEIATPAMVIVCAPARPTTLPNSPATKAAISGNIGMRTSRVGFMFASAPQGIQVFDVDTAPFAEQHHENRQSYRGFGSGHREHEEHEHLPVEVAQVTREGDEVEVRRQQQ